MSKRSKKQGSDGPPQYCVKCKKHTSTSGSQVVKTKNGRNRLVGQCTVCGTKKSKFISGQQAEGLLGNLLGTKIPILSDIPLLNILF